MKSIIAFLFPIAVVVSSCEKVIPVDLNRSSPQIVIEGLVNDQGGTDSVIINMTGEYFSPSLNFPPIDNATVTISDNAGDMDTLTHAGNGVYYSQGPEGVPGRTYSLKVLANGSEYDAVSTMPSKISIESFYAVPSGGTGYDFYVRFRKTSNGYLFYTVRVNSAPFGGICKEDSITGSGNTIDSIITVDGREMYLFSEFEFSHDFNPGDTVRFYLGVTDSLAYNYWWTLQNVTTNDQQFLTSLSSPGNPGTNLTNNALGYFAAYTIDSKSLVIK